MLDWTPNIEFSTQSPEKDPNDVLKNDLDMKSLELKRLKQISNFKRKYHNIRNCNTKKDLPKTEL